ncbi:MAG TPA: hypothetical protein VKZ18_03045 [Polyangia bacterium]|nr:hypothetical protein [Polyangia bacterium]
MRFSRRQFAMLASVVGLAIASPAWATLVLALDLPALVKRAEQVSVVDVVSVKVGWNEEHDRIVTTVDLAVVDCWKGSAAPASRVQVVQPGGTVDGLTMRVEGLPRFSPGERALLFLRFPRETPGRASVVGMAQGKRAVRREAASGRWMVSAPERGGADYVQTTPASATQWSAPPRPLGDLRTEVRALVAGGGR